ncbi:MerR family DNA-binding protein [Magnetovibrio sp. PR-2]|uniref:MerR family transcriptional regulator n=1 Tax=Magnetovibrio sp. PR-2 TaxID=3120356 RepID=UPI002FCE29C3
MMNIGDVARQGGVTVEAMRYYEREGLIAEPDRDINGYRRYDPDAVRRIHFIKRAQDVGFTLKDIKELLSLMTDPDATCCNVRDRAEGKIHDIEQKIASLTSMKTVLSAWVEECRGAGPISECPILDALEMEEND